MSWAHKKKVHTGVRLTASPFPWLPQGASLEYTGPDEEMRWQFYQPGSSVRPIEVPEEGMPSYWPLIWIWGLTDKKPYRVSRKEVSRLTAKRAAELAV